MIQNDRMQNLEFKNCFPFRFQISTSPTVELELWIGIKGREIRLDLFYTDSYRMTS